jgi:hypothetical protein
MRRKYAAAAWRIARIQLSVFLGHIRRYRSHLLQSWTGDDPNAGSNRWAVYSHYHSQGHVFDYNLFVLRALSDAGFRIVFVTNSRKFDPAQLGRLKPWCAKVIKRRNVGYDFGAYREGILAIEDFSSREALVLMNDSVYGPLFAFNDTLSQVSSEECDIWGMTDSWAHAYHLQSYFYYFRSPVLKSPDFLEFWRNIPLVNYKRGVVERLEIELSQFFLARGYRLGAAFQYFTVVDRFLSRFNRQLFQDAQTYFGVGYEIAAARIRRHPEKSPISADLIWSLAFHEGLSAHRLGKYEVSDARLALLEQARLEHLDDVVPLSSTHGLALFIDRARVEYTRSN